MIRRHFSLVNIDKVSSRECVNRDEVSLSAPGQGRAPPTAPITTPSPFPQARNTTCQRLLVVDACDAHRFSVPNAFSRCSLGTKKDIEVRGGRLCEGRCYAAFQTCGEDESLQQLGEK
jgi:hypothetical protein